MASFSFEAHIFPTPLYTAPNLNMFLRCILQLLYPESVDRELITGVNFFLLRPT